MATFYTPTQYVGKTLRQIRDEGNSFRPDLLGVDENTPLTANQKITFKDDPGSGEYQFLNNKFIPESTFQQQQQQSLLDSTKAKQDEFLGRVKGIPGALSALSDELGVTAAQNTFKTAGETARNVSGMISDVAPTQQTIAKQVGISAPRIQQRTAAEVGKLQPTLESATRGLTAAQAGLESVLGTYDTQAEGIFKTFDIESGVLGDQVKNEFDMFKTTTQQNLDRELAQLAQTGFNDRAALDRAAKLAEAEKAVTSGTFVDLGNKYALINPITGKEISSFTKGIAPKIAGISEWE